MSLMAIDVKSQQVTFVTVPQPKSSDCARTDLHDSAPDTWKLVDGFPIVEKLWQERMNKARMLVYPPVKRLLPIQK
jgi:hypothetical protein